MKIAVSRAPGEERVVTPLELSSASVTTGITPRPARSFTAGA